MTQSPRTRREDARLLTGRGRFVADFVTPRTAFAGFLRADLASARVAGLDLSAVRAAPGVLGVVTAEDLDAAGIGPLRHEPLPREDGGTAEEFPQPILSATTIRHVGEPLALVAASSPQALADALDLADVTLEEVPPPAGRAFLRRFGDVAAAEAALAGAVHRARITLAAPRVTAFALEPRGAIATPDDKGGLTYRVSTQNPFALRAGLSDTLGLSPERVRVLAEDVGGSFGLKGFMTREDAALAFAARHLGCELAWLPARSETMLADVQGRAIDGVLEVGLDAGHRIVAVAGRFAIDCGAYPSRRAYGLMNNVRGMTGVYDVPVAGIEIEGRLSARVPLAPFRGNGRPEATHAIERALDAVARQAGIDPVALRRANLIAPAALPVKTALGAPLDCGDFPRVMAEALALNGDPAPRRAAAEAQGLLYGVGLANCIESAAGPKPDHARLTLDASGGLTLAPGVMSVGQGHETALSRLVAERLELPQTRITYVNGDTEAVSHGRGSGGSAGLTVAGSATWVALDTLLAEGRQIAAARFGCPEEALVLRDGGFHRQDGNETLSLAQIAADKGGVWRVEGSFAPEIATYPNGTHLCEVAVDPETGALTVTRYAAVEDVGRVLNPVLVEGQLMGGIAQGLSIGLGERIRHDVEGQLLTGSLMDYSLVRARDVPMMALASVEVPTARNPLGVKGVGEAGTVGGMAAFASAVSDALARAGVADFDLPATPDRVWHALDALRAP